MLRIFLPLLLVAHNVCYGQPSETTWPKTLHTPTDTFYVSFSRSAKKYPMRVSKSDTVDMGTDAAPDLSVTIYYGNDSLNIPYRNLPYAQVHYIPVKSPGHSTIYRLHFNGIAGYFSPAYIDKYGGATQTEIPEVYELANIIWTLSPSGARADDLQKEGEYYKRVANHFKPYLNHPVFKELDFPDSIAIDNYYDFRENSFTYKFKGDKLVCEGPYYYVKGNDWDSYNNLFRKLLPLVEDFARKSSYKKFYNDNKAYYAQQIKRQNELMPVKNMWLWLEEKFPATKFQSYKVVFSPLIGGSHSTQQYSTYYKGGFFSECVMFVCGPGSYDAADKLTEKQKQGLFSGVVFTEIDHNYVNRESYKFRTTIDSIFKNRDVWVRPGVSADYYESSLAVFNEYMTHSLFCLWVLDNYDKEVADLVIGKREALMTERRDFIEFKAFNTHLINMYKENKHRPIPELYPRLLEACKTINQR